MKLNFLRQLLLAAVALAFFAGCMTPQVNWNARVGHYTLDQAVVELGPPDKQAKLTDGRIIAEWVTRYNTGGTVVIGAGFYHHYPGSAAFIQTPGPNYYEQTLRLTFGADQILSTWSRK